MDQITSVESLQVDFGTIRAATDKFSDANKLTWERWIWGSSQGRKKL